MGDVWSMEKGKECWNPTFIRLFNYWELEDVERPLLQLRDKKVIKGLGDTFQWKRARNGVFSVKSLYKMLEQRPSVSFHWKCIWRSSASKYLYFCVGSFLGEDLNVRSIEEKRNDFCE